MDAKEFFATAKGKATVVAGSALALAPGLAFAEGETGTNATISDAIVNMATTVANDGVAMMTAVVPVLVPIVGTIILARLGYSFVKRFAK